jgi:serine/threonine-protein kinase RsbW
MPLVSDAASGARFRLLQPDEGGRLSEAIRTAYGETYELTWVYDAAEAGRRLANGLLVSAIAESSDGELLCHVALSLHSRHDRVGHVGQGVTLPAARGQHLFTATKRTLVAEAQRRALVGVYSEATAAHPYSQRANVEIGAHETGILLGFIPASVANDAARVSVSGRQSVVLFYLRTSTGPVGTVYAPSRHREVVHDTIATSGMHARLAEPPARHRPVRRSVVHTHHDVNHRAVLVTVAAPGADLGQVVGEVRDRCFEGPTDVLYVDLPLATPETALYAEQLEVHGVSYAGIFPNRSARGDVIRFQALNGARPISHDVSVASEHGSRLLAYILADLGDGSAP